MLFYRDEETTGRTQKINNYRHMAVFWVRNSIAGLYDRIQAGNIQPAFLLIWLDLVALGI
jgi:hypothetical protein